MGKATITFNPDGVYTVLLDDASSNSTIKVTEMRSLWDSSWELPGLHPVPISLVIRCIKAESQGLTQVQTLDWAENLEVVSSTASGWQRLAECLRANLPSLERLSFCAEHFWTGFFLEDMEPFVQSVVTFLKEFKTNKYCPIPTSGLYCLFQSRTLMKLELGGICFKEEDFLFVCRALQDNAVLQTLQGIDVIQNLRNPQAYGTVVRNMVKKNSSLRHLSMTLVGIREFPEEFLMGLFCGIRENMALTSVSLHLETRILERTILAHGPILQAVKNLVEENMTLERFHVTHHDVGPGIAYPLKWPPNIRELMKLYLALNRAGRRQLFREDHHASITRKAWLDIIRRVMGELHTSKGRCSALFYLLSHFPSFVPMLPTIPISSKKKATVIRRKRKRRSK
jgi:hypothetical protein